MKKCNNCKNAQIERSGKEITITCVNTHAVKYYKSVSPDSELENMPENCNNWDKLPDKID